MPGRTIKHDEEAIREAEEELRPKRDEQIDQSRGNTGKRNVRVVKKHTTTQQDILYIYVAMVYHNSFMYTIRKKVQIISYQVYRQS